MSSSTAVTPNFNPPPMPLRRAPVVAPSTGASAAESAFLSRSALLQRNLTGNRAAPASPRTFTAPIPLQLSGQAAQVMPLRPLPRVAAPVLASPPLVAAPLPPGPPGVAAPQAPPADIAQRMQQALDKYQRLEAQRPAAVDLRQ
jgi:negative regulator of sigma E activity